MSTPTQTNALHDAMKEVAERVHAQMTAQDGKLDGYEIAAVIGTITIGDEGADLNGWITYKNTTQGKIEFHSTSCTSHWGFFAGGFPNPYVPVPPHAQIPEKGRYKCSGLVSAGVLELFRLDGTLILKVPLAGIGSPLGWGAEGDVAFTHCKPQ